MAEWPRISMLDLACYSCDYRFQVRCAEWDGQVQITGCGHCPTCGSAKSIAEGEEAEARYVMFCHCHPGSKLDA